MTTILDARLEELHKEFMEALKRFRENILLANRPMMVADPGLNLDELKPGTTWRAHRGEWDGEEACFRAPEFKAWAIQKLGASFVVIGTRADAEAKALAMGGGAMVFGPYEFTIAVKP